MFDFSRKNFNDSSQVINSKFLILYLKTDFNTFIAKRISLSTCLSRILKTASQWILFVFNTRIIFKNDLFIDFCFFSVTGGGVIGVYQKKVLRYRITPSDVLRKNRVIYGKYVLSQTMILTGIKLMSSIRDNKRLLKKQS